MRNRDIDLHFRLSKEEFDHLEKQREKAGLSREAFIRSSIMDAEIQSPPSIDFLNYHRELRRVGSNIEQILRLANTKKLIDVPLLRKTLDDLHQTQRSLWNEFARRDT